MKKTTYTATTSGADLSAVTTTIPELTALQVLIKITHCGVCRSDWHFLHNSWGDGQFPMVPGHEIVGEVIAVGVHVTDVKLGERVGVSWQTDACWHCEWCARGREEFCAKLQGIGIGAEGGFADHIVVDQHFVYPLPFDIESAYLAPLMCAGATAYNALQSFPIKPGGRVAILGIGGIGHLAVQFAHKMGYEVTAFTNQMDLCDEIKALGAQHVLSSENAQLAHLKDQFDFVLSTIDTDIDYQPFIDMLRPLGKLCFIGIPVKPIAISVFSLIIGQKIIGAVPLGSRQMIRDMLEFAAAHGVRPRIEQMPMNQVNSALQKLEAGLAHYRIVLYNV